MIDIYIPQRLKMTSEYDHHSLHDSYQSIADWKIDKIFSSRIGATLRIFYFCSKSILEMNPLIKSLT